VVLELDVRKAIGRRAKVLGPDVGNAIRRAPNLHATRQLRYLVRYLSWHVADDRRGDDRGNQEPTHSG
jgi:hypothetical protein